MTVRFNNQICIVKKCGKIYSKNFNNQGEGGGWRNKYGLFNEKGEKVGAITGGYLGNYNIMKDGQVIGSIRLSDDYFS